jgi:hypothetical protein
VQRFGMDELSHRVTSLTTSFDPGSGVGRRRSMTFGSSLDRSAPAE